MPLLVKDYKWTETPTHIHIQVPLKGVKSSKVDVFCGEEFIKVHYPPYLFEVLLYKHVDDVKSSAIIRDNLVSLTLFKYEEEMWGRISSTKSDDKKFVLSKKIEAIEAAQKKKEKEIEQRKIEKDRTKKYTVNEMLKLEQGDRARIENIKNEERTRTERELEEWKIKKKNEAENQLLKKIDEIKINKLQQQTHDDVTTHDDITTHDDVTTHDDITTHDDVTTHDDATTHDDVTTHDDITTHDDVIFQSDDIINEEDVDIEVKKENKKAKETVKKTAMNVRSGGIRENCSIKVSFTPRVFPTPVRESKTLEENDWLEKQALARKTFLVDDPDLQDHEKDPDWLIDKANQLFISGDIQGAVNAYTLAIRVRPHMPLLYTNRAACHLKLRKLYKSLDDSSKALELLKPEVDENAKLRMKSHVRRATAFCELELYVEALQDYEAALKIEPKNESLLQDAKKIRKFIQSDNDDGN